MAHKNFESALARLEAIIHSMEADRLPLEELLACYEEGTKLVKVCSGFLSSAEQKIELLTRTEPNLIPFNPAGNIPAASPVDGAVAPSPGKAKRSSSNQEVSLF